jgi:alkylation response protein AidB-like acyl-CoA dehydrogenase
MKSRETALLRTAVPAAQGGEGRTWIDLAANFAREAGEDGDLGKMMRLAGQAWALKALLDHGNSVQIATYVPRILIGVPCATALAEPQSGTDLAHIHTRLHRKGDGWLLQGQKRNISLGRESWMMIVLAKNEGDEQHRLVVLDRARHAWGNLPAPDKIGLLELPTNDLEFNNLPITAEDLLAPAQNALAVLADFMTFGRALIGIGVAAILQKHLQTVLEFAANRQSQGRSIDSQQYVQHKLTDIQLAITQTQTLAQAALVAHLAASPQAIALGNMTKITAAQALLDASQAMVGIMGTSGFQVGPIGQLAVDALAFQAIGGTEEAHRMSLWKQMQRGVV